MNGEETVLITASANAELLATAERFRSRRAWVIGDAQLDLDAAVRRVGTTWPL